MVEERLTLLLLPGMDGTGDLFADFLKLVPNWIEPHVVRYPGDKRLSYDQLFPVLRSAVPSNKTFVVLAESFSTPLAVRLAAEAPNGLRALVLCAGFVSSPRHGLMRRAGLILAPVFFAFGLPESLCRRFLVGATAPKVLVDFVRATISSVSNRVLAYRLRSVLTCNVEQELGKISVPVLYISGLEDRLVLKSSFQEIKKMKSDVLLAGVEAPHLILQTRPREVADIVLEFLRQVQSEPR